MIRTTNLKFVTDLEEAQIAWRKVMASHGDEWGIVRAFPSACKLESHHLADARVFADRYAYMTNLPPGAVCAEVGVWKGDFSAYILDFATPSRLHLIDVDLQRFAVRQRFAGHPNVTCHEGRSVDVLDTLPDDTFDWIYIDAGHSYDEARADAIAATPKLKQDGLLIFNDYIFWSHTEARPYGVVQAVNEMCVAEGWKVVAFCLHSAMYCDIAIKR